MASTGTTRGLRTQTSSSGRSIERSSDLDRLNLLLLLLYEGQIYFVFLRVHVIKVSCKVIILTPVILCNHVHCRESIQFTRSVLTNQRPVFRSRDHSLTNQRPGWMTGRRLMTPCAPCARAAPTWGRPSAARSAPGESRDQGIILNSSIFPATN